MSMDRGYQLQRLTILVADAFDAKHWQIVAPDEVPEWLKNPAIMGQLGKGQVANNTMLEPTRYYRAEVINGRPSIHP